MRCIVDRAEIVAQLRELVVWCPRDGGSSCVSAEVDSIAASVLVQPRSGRNAIKTVAQPGELVLNERIEWIQNQRSHRCRPRFVRTLADARSPMSALALHRVVPPPGTSGIWGGWCSPSSRFFDECGGDREEETLRFAGTGTGRDDDVAVIGGRCGKSVPLV